MFTKALILVDLENQWLDSSSDYYVGDIADFINKTNQLIDYCRAQKYKIIFIRHVEKDSDKDFIDNTFSTEIIKDLHKIKTDTVITKYKISAFYQTNLTEELKAIKEIVIAGILTNLCVRSLIQDAYDREFEIKVTQDCCLALDKETHDFTLKDLKATREEIEFLDFKEFIR